MDKTCSVWIVGSVGCVILYLATVSFRLVYIHERVVFNYAHAQCTFLGVVSSCNNGGVARSLVCVYPLTGGRDVNAQRVHFDRIATTSFTKW